MPVIAHIEPSDADLAAFQKLAFELAGIRIAANKREMMAARLGRRLTALSMNSYRAYFDYLTADGGDGDERERFINCITTNKTGFFREPHHFDLLREQVIPALRARVATGAPRRLRIWSCACSSGEEPYSIAMIAHRELSRDNYAIEIIASDIDTEVLARTEDACYTADEVATIPPDLRLRYLERFRDGWRVSSELRELVKVHHVNLTHGAFPFTGPFDAIFIRNVIIYFDRPTQRALFQRLRSYLADTGHLFLGHSESLLHIIDTFVPAGRTVYRPRMTPPGSRSRRRATATVTPLGRERVVASAQPLRIDLVVGPSVAVCVFDPEAGAGGLIQLLDGAGRATELQAEQEVLQLAARLVELGASRHKLRGKLVGGGGARSADREVGARTTQIAESVIRRAGIALTSKRTGGDQRLEIQFFTSSGRLLCRECGTGGR